MIDIRHTDDGDIDLTTGDVAWTEPTAQHQRDLLIAAPGQFKESPLVGVDSVKYLLDEDRTGYLRTVRQQFTRDGMTVRRIDMDAYNDLIIDAEYEENKG